KGRTDGSFAVRGEVRRTDRGVEVIGLLSSLGKGEIEARIERPRHGGGHFFVGQPKLYDCALAGRDSNPVLAGDFGSRSRCVYRFVCAVDNVVVDSILNVRRSILRAEKTPVVGLVLREKQFSVSSAVKPSVAVIRVVQLHRDDTFDGLASAQPRPLRPRVPGPGIAKPERRQQVKLRGFGSAIDRLDSDQNVIRRGFGVFNEDIKIAVLVKNSRVNQLEFY